MIAYPPGFYKRQRQRQTDVVGKKYERAADELCLENVAVLPTSLRNQTPAPSPIRTRDPTSLESAASARR